MKSAAGKIEELKKDFLQLKDQEAGEQRILAKLRPYEENLDDYLAPWVSASKTSTEVYPSQGLLLTPYDELSMIGFRTLPTERVIETLRMRMFFLEFLNHPYKIHFLDQVTASKFIPPPKIKSKTLQGAFESGLSLSIRDIGASIGGADKDRVSRTNRLVEETFIKLGKQGRIFFTGSASPDVWSSSLAVATMAACHGLAGIPRNGLLYDVKRQADVARETFDVLGQMAEFILKGRTDRKKVLGYWRRNVMGVVESGETKALVRAEALYKAGVRAFRVYSPEPGVGPIETVKRLKKELGKGIEVFAGQIVEVGQGKKAEEAGADGIYVGVGGGGRCITGVRSGSVIDWPELVWYLRGEIGIPIIAEGGASDHVAVSFLLGASGISTSRIVAGGTIESPGGALYCVDEQGKLFKPYGGEASARVKFAEGKMLPFGIPAFVEGETAKAMMSYVKEAQPTLTYNLYLLMENAILALVFRGVSSLAQLQAIDPSPLRQVTSLGTYQIGSH